MSVCSAPRFPELVLRAGRRRPPPCTKVFRRWNFTAIPRSWGRDLDLEDMTRAARAPVVHPKTCAARARRADRDTVPPRSRRPLRTWEREK